MQDPRCALIADDERCGLGPLTLRINALGIEAYYATHLDELVLMSRDLGTSPGIIVLPTETSLAVLGEVKRRLALPLGLVDSAIVTAGVRGSDQEVQALREAGLRWSIREPATDQELRFAIKTAIAEHDPMDLGFERRVPTEIRAELDTGSAHRSGQIADLTSGGAFFGLDEPLEPGTEVTVRFDLAECQVELRSQVVWVRKRAGSDETPLAQSGVGISFQDPPRETRQRLRSYVEAEFSRFLL